jgi:hypothetical protein
MSRLKDASFRLCQWRQGRKKEPGAWWCVTGSDEEGRWTYSGRKTDAATVDFDEMQRFRDDMRRLGWQCRIDVLPPGHTKPSEVHVFRQKATT